MSVGPFADAVIVAAGGSSRMAGIDKVAAPLLGRPVLAWTLDAMRAARAIGRVIVVARPERVAGLREAAWVRATGAEVVEGGPRRQASVAAGVRAVDAAYVLVHDGARPLVSPGLVDRVAEATRAHGAAIPVVPVAETLKRVAADGRVSATVDRTDLVTAQTPQGATRQLLLDAYRRFDPLTGPEFTDEAALLEAAGVPVATVPGEAVNLKVTLPDDLARAEALLGGNGPTRVASGYDSHPFGAGDGLALGGIVIDGAPRLHGHSDGDAALHAIADAMLGVTASGDLGRLFPAGDAQTRGIASSRLLEEVVRRVAAAGWHASAVDLTLLGARPRLGAARLDAMRHAIARLLGLDAASVAVKAASGNLSGDEGAGRVITATALVTLVRHPSAHRTMAE